MTDHAEPSEPDWIEAPLRQLDELTAFDAARRFLEIWFNVGGRSEGPIAIILTAMTRSSGSYHGPPADRALWDDWREAVAYVIEHGPSGSDRDPLAS